MTDTTPNEQNEPETMQTAMEGGQVFTVLSWTDIGAQAALVLAEKESKLTGWQFLKNGIRNDRGMFVWILTRADGTDLSAGPTWKELTKGIKP